MSAATLPADEAGQTDAPDPMTKALNLAARGLHVLPVASDKRPAPGWGVMSATADAQEIVDAFITTGAPLVGVACGASGIVVVDIDNHPGGANGFASIAKSPEITLPSTWSHTSMSGDGLHLVYAESGEHAPGRPLDGVDLKAGNGYIVWAGDVPESREQFAPAPAWTHRSARPSTGEAAPDLLQRWLANRPGTPGGSLAERIKGLPPLGSEEWSDANLTGIARGLIRAAEDFDGGAAAYEAFVNGYAAGQWSDAEHRAAAARAFANAIRFSVETDGINPDAPPITSAQLLDMLAAPQAATVAPEAPRTRSFDVLTLSDLRNRPRPEWLISGVVQGAGIVALVGDGGIGKSFLVVDWAAAVATGRSWQGRDVKPGRVLYVLGEGAEFFPDRIDAWQSEHGVTIPEDRLHIVDDPFSLQDPENVADARHYVTDGEGYDLVILDTLSQTAAMDNENDNAEMAHVLRQAKAIRTARLGTTVLIVHHTAKAGGARGASAFRDNVDIMILALGNSEGFMLTTRQSDGGKMKNAPDLYESGYFLKPVEPSAVMTRSGDTTDPLKVAVNAVLDRGGEHGIREFLVEYGEDTESASKKIRRYLGSLVERGLAVQAGNTKRSIWTRPF